MSSACRCWPRSRWCPPSARAATTGVPTVAAEPDSEVAEVFDRLATSIVDLGPARVYRKELSLS